jgi:2-hydroxy-6-oxonona-2,4-dienedioate hydrolase
MRTVWTDVDGIRMHAAVGGRGSPVVLLHGYGVSGAYMLPLARRLTPFAKVLVPDLPGQGKSGRNGGGCGIGEFADVLGEWLDAVELVRPAFVANSFGCQIVTELAVRRPNRVGPMVLVGPTIDPARRSAPRQLAGALRDAKREPFSLLGRASRDNAAAGLRHLLPTARSALADRIEERLPKLEQRVVVVFGENDGFIGLEWATEAAVLLPRGRLVVVPGEPHAVHYTRPDLVADIVRELLVEERQDAVGQLARRLEHRDMSAGDVDDARLGDQLVPLRGNARRDEPVVLSPHE